MFLRNMQLMPVHALVATIVLAGCVFAQTGGPKADAKKTEPAKSAVPTTVEEPTPAAPQLNGAQTSAAPPADFESPKDDLNDITPIPDQERQAEKTSGDSTADARITALEERLTRLENLLAAQESALQSARDQLAEVRNNIAQRVARQDPTVDPANPTESAPLVNVGKLMVENRTPMGYQMAINGALYFVPPGHRGELRVPVGAVVTELRGFEAPRAWKEADWKKVGDEYQLAIQIQ